MTAFDNIKTNNWPSTDNALKDYLALDVNLTTSDYNFPGTHAGRQLLWPERPATNTNGVSVAAAGSNSYGLTHAAYFSGSSFLSYDYVLPFNGTSWSVDFFFKADSINQYESILGQLDSSSNKGWYIDSQSAGSLNLLGYYGGSQTRTGNITVANDTWYFSRISCTAGVGMKWYLNGSLAGTITNTGTFGNGYTVPFQIGMGGGSNTGYAFHGLMANLRVYYFANDSTSIPALVNGVYS